jgi:hypothetical protein
MILAQESSGRTRSPSRIDATAADAAPSAIPISQCSRVRSTTPGALRA